MTKAASIVKNYNISGLYLRAYLATLRKVTGNQYPRLLEKAGLAQFIEKYPPADHNTVATGAQFMQLKTLFVESLDPALYELLQKNLGREFARAVTGGPAMQQEVQTLGSLMLLENLERATDIVIEFNNSTIDQKVYRGSLDDPVVKRVLATCPKGGVVMIYKNCIYCAHQASADKPVCLTIVTYLKEVLTIMAASNGSGNLRIQTEEVYCAAQEKSTDCYFLIKRL